MTYNFRKITVAICDAMLYNGIMTEGVDMKNFAMPMLWIVAVVLGALALVFVPKFIFAVTMGFPLSEVVWW